MSYIEANKVTNIRRLGRAWTIAVESEKGNVSLYYLDNHQSYLAIDVGPWTYEIPWEAIDQARRLNAKRD